MTPSFLEIVREPSRLLFFLHHRGWVGIRPRNTNSIDPSWHEEHYLYNGSRNDVHEQWIPKKLFDWMQLTYVIELDSGNHDYQEEFWLGCSQEKYGTDYRAVHHDLQQFLGDWVQSHPELMLKLRRLERSSKLKRILQ